jgi:hypothetical protein
VSGLPGTRSTDERHQELVELRDDRRQVGAARHAHLAEEGCPLRLPHASVPKDAEIPVGVPSGTVVWRRLIASVTALARIVPSKSIVRQSVQMSN